MLGVSKEGYVRKDQEKESVRSVNQIEDLFQVMLVGDVKRRC